MTKTKSLMQFFYVMGKHSLGVTFFFLGLFPLLYICLLFTRQVYRTFPSLIEDVWDFFNSFFWENLIIIIAQKKFPKKLICCPKNNLKKF